VRHHVIKACLCGLALGAGGIPREATASGYQVREQSAVAQGVSQAGSAARGDDPSMLFFNPAAMAWLSGTQVVSVASGIFPRSETRSGSATRTAVLGNSAIGGSLGGDAGVDAFVPALYATTGLSDQWRVGVGITSPWGLVTKYPNDYIGRYHALTSSLRTVNVTPSVSYRPLPNLAFGVGLQVQQATARLSSAVDFGSVGALSRIPGFAPGARDGRVTTRGDDIAAGFQLGVQWEPVPGSRLGLGFRSAMFHELRGDAAFQGVPFPLTASAQFSNTRINAKVATPESVTFGYSQRLGERWTALLGAEWTNWSRFRDLTINFENGRAPSITEQRWRDTVFLSAGAEFRATDAVTLRAGFAWDKSPVPDANRTPRIPDSDRYWLSAGATWQVTPNMALTAAYTRVFANESRINLRDSGPGSVDFLRGNLDTTNRASVDIVSFQARLAF
jgi:long-chain fatty acid transport protein